jgi:hypothetical protein
MVRTLLVGIFICLLAMPAMGNGQGRAGPADGVYALHGGRLMCIADRAFEIFVDSERLGRTRVTGRADVAGHGFTLRYFDGEREIEARTTYAIVNGRLWLATMRQTFDAGVWYGEALDMSVFGPARPGGAAGAGALGHET